MKSQRLMYLGLLTAIALTILCGLGFGSQAGKEYDESEKELNVTYKKVLATVNEPDERLLLVEAQRSWIKFRDAEVAFHARYFPASKGGLFVATDMTKERTEKLKILLTDSAKQEHEAPFGKTPTK